MRTIETTSRFRRDFKREAKGAHSKQLDVMLANAVELLATDATMPAPYRDHALVGDWKDFRDCHLRPDLVLIYRKPDDRVLQLVRLGSHSQLGLGSPIDTPARFA